ncbi:MAG: hypothetical protein H0W83_17610, partial [Planctomycetes bacterium]|nr:hypothetical protein [Planctomycetota bacterium]
MTSSLVLELQHLASDEKTPVSALLLKAKMVAVKLGRDDIQEMLDLEMKGYQGSRPKGELPKYRIVQGSLVVHNPYNGLLPVTFHSADYEEAMTRTFVSNSITEIEQTLSDPKGNVFHVPLGEKRRKRILTEVDTMDMPLLNV